MATPIHDPAEPEPFIAHLARWARGTGGISMVSVRVTQTDGTSIEQTVEFFDCGGFHGDEDA